MSQLGKIRHKLLSGLINRTGWIARARAGGPSLALAFDDGPNPTYTPQLLDLLLSQNVRATFFLIGKHVEAHPEIVERMVQGGHELGGHSYSHNRFHALPLASQLEEIRVADSLLRHHDGCDTHVFRPPQGRLGLALAATFWRTRRPVLMDVYDSLDYRNVSASAITQVFAARPVKHGDVVQFHDDNEYTLRAVEELLPAWRQQGFSFLTVSEMLQQQRRGAKAL